MSLRKVIQKHTKQSITETENTKMPSIITDTVCTADGGATTWKTIYTTLENGNPKVRDVQPIADST